MSQLIAVSARKGELAETSADTRVVGIFDGADAPVDTIAKLVESGEIKSSYKTTGVAHAHGARYVIVGLGKAEDFTAERARVAGAVGAARASELGAKSIAWLLPSEGDSQATAGAIVEGTLLKSYKFDEYKSKGDDDGDDDKSLSSLEIVSETADLADAVAAAAIGGNAVNAARDLQNQPSNVATPSYLADRASEIAAKNDMEFSIHDRQWIESKGMGAFAAVAKGTPEEPQLIVLKYNGAGPEAPTLGFVGKAVTFDTGGISLKPSGKMEEMKFDMSGGAAVLEATNAIAQLKLPINLITVVPSTENMPSGTATKPGDIVRAYNGKTIEIDNTDAEGRLILADALTYAIELGADKVVNLATLTGAIIVALGSTYAGVFSNDDDWSSEVVAAGDATGEIGHRLPLHPEFADLIKGKYADISNAPGSRKGSSITAAEFLKNFVGDTPWVHLDIAGTAWDLGRPYVGNGASGFGVRLLIELARAHAE